MYNITHKTHPLYEKNTKFIKEIFLEFVYNNDLSLIIPIAMTKSDFSIEEYGLIYENHNDIILGMIIHIIDQSDIYVSENMQDITGVKKILHKLIMFQIRLYPLMPIVFKNILPKSIFQITDSVNFFMKIIDNLWYHAGDKATDFNYYSKRILLAKIYIKTMLYAISDNSDNYSDTENFLYREFNRIDIFHKISGKIPNIYKISENIASIFGKIRYR